MSGKGYATINGAVSLANAASNSASPSMTFTGSGTGASNPRDADGAWSFPWDPSPMVDLIWDNDNDEYARRRTKP
jgi:hypothetical protein